MTAKDVIRDTIGLAHSITCQYLKDLSDADLLVRTSPGANPIAWQLGHLIVSERDMIAAVGGRMPALPAGFEQAHSPEAARSDGGGYRRKEEYLALLKAMHDATRAALDATPDADLDKPGPESMRSYAPTVGAVFHMAGQHELMHVGQFAALRRKLEKPIVI